MVVVDVGCRWGIPNRWAELAGTLLVYAFDADARECSRLQDTAPAGVTYVPYALGGKEASAQLHVTEEPACSSLFPPDELALSMFPALRIAGKVGVREVALHTLDGWADDAGVKAVDVIKLDVQGAELAVLRGAAKLLSTVRTIELEVTFNPIYAGQPLFGDVDKYLRNRGFRLWRLAHLVHYSREGQDARIQRSDRQFFDGELVEFKVGGGQITWGHAFYCAEEIARGNWTSSSVAMRDACAAELLGLDELVEPALARAAQLGHNHAAAPSG
jgi:FkbM family methyltransferase